jgi:hypothetical protein
LPKVVITTFGKGEVLMPKLKNRLPKICRNRNQAFSKNNGKRIYHGVWGSPEAEKSYKRFIAALLDSPVVALRHNGDGGVLVSELATAFLDAHEGKLHGHAHQFR